MEDINYHLCKIFATLKQNWAHYTEHSPCEEPYLNYMWFPINWGREWSHYVEVSSVMEDTGGDINVDVIVIVAI